MSTAKDGQRLTVSPHVLRHTFLRKLAEEKGVQYAKEASGHRSDRYLCGDNTRRGMRARTGFLLRINAAN